jgi:glutaredoxin
MDGADMHALTETEILSVRAKLGLRATLQNALTGLGVAALCFVLGFYGVPWFVKTLKTPVTVQGNYQSHYQATGKLVVLYGTSTCPYCQQARAYLAARGIDFADENLSKSGPSQVRFDALKMDGVPVILIGAHLIHGFDPQAIDFALGKSKVLINPQQRVLPL